MGHTMILLILGLIVFSAVHFAIGLRAGRAKLENRFGRLGLRAFVALGALLGLALMAQGYSMARFYPIWTPVAWGHELGAVLMPVASILLVAAYVPSNIKKITAHPMLIAVILWAITHLLVRGDWASLLLFGGLGLYSALAMGLAWMRGVRPATTQKSPWFDGLVVVIGLTLYGGLLIAHPHLFGVSVFQ